MTKTKFIFLIIIMFEGLMFGNEIKIDKVYVSSIEKNDQNLKGENAIDENSKTRWASEWQDPQWIYFDFGQITNFDFLNILWETAYGKSYDIQISNDTENWKTIKKITNAQGGREKIYIGKNKARFLKLNLIERGTIYGYSIFDFKIYKIDDEKTPDSPKNLSIIRNSDTIFIQWDDNTETDLQGYNIYRSTDPSGKFGRINNEIVSGSKFKDKTFDQQKVYFYRISALDYPGNESKTTNIEQANLIQSIKRNYYNIPACAWKRAVGDIPENCSSMSPNRGIALGGFGAGSFMYNISGSFGPFQSFDGVMYKGKWLKDAAFHIYEKIGNNASKVKCLSTSTNKKAWDCIKPGEADYYALQPVGWTTYNNLTTDVSSKFFSPIIPNNYKETSYPVAVFLFKVHNSTKEKSTVSVMLTFPDVFIGNNFTEDQWSNSFINNSKIKGVVLESKNNLGQWCIASTDESNAKVTYLTNWNNKGDGSDVLDNFAKDGNLPDSGNNDIVRAAALSINVELNPDEEKIIPICISWDFPVVRFGKGTEWWKKYTEYFGRTGKNAFNIAKTALENYNTWEEEIDKWMNPIVNNAKYPDWLKCAAFNELYYSQFGGIFYEAGLKSGTAHEFKNLHENDNKFFEMECMAYPFANTFDVRHYSSIIYAKFWPKIERELLINWADAIVYFDKELHQTPHDCGSPQDDPYFNWDTYGTNKLHWKDLHSKFIQQCWRYWYLYKDKKFIDYVWKACKATYGYMKKTDVNGDGLPDNNKSDNTYDSWGLYGTSLLCGGLWVGALESMLELSKIKNDSIITAEVSAMLVKAKNNLDKQLWYAKKGYYKIDSASDKSTAIMSDGLNGQRYCESYGLPDILPKEKMASHLMEVYKRCVVPLADYNGDGVGECGAINGINEDGTMLNKGQSDEIWTGSTYYLAASMYHAGLHEEALKTAYGIYYQTYVNEKSAYWFNTPEAWMNKGVNPRPADPHQYQRPRAVWELLLEIDDPFLMYSEK